MFIISCDGDSSSNTGKSGSMARFAISGNHLYTVSNWDLSVFDISNAAKPEKVSGQFLSGFAETIFSKDSILFFGTRNGMLIYDNTNPAKPVFMSDYSHIYSCDPVVVHKNFAFVTLNSSSWNCGRSTNRLDIIDVSDLDNPIAVAQHDMVSPKGLGIDGNMLFVCDDGLKAYKLDDFSNIELMDKFDVDAYDVIPDNGYLFLIGNDGFHQFKYTDKSLYKLSSILTDS